MSKFDGIDLQFMLDRQHWLQVNSFGGDPGSMVGQERKDFVTAMALALVTEVAEVMQEVAWKPWAQTDHLNRDAYLEELVDVWHFLMNLMLVANITAAEFTEAYLQKSNVNVKRQLDGYTGLDKQKESGKL